MLDYKLIEALAMVAREGGFDRGAKALFITQSAVSQRIKQLEELTGQVLLARTSPPRLTGAGQKILKHYRQVRRLEDDLFADIGEASEDEFASLAVGVNADSLAFWFLDAVRPFLLAERVVLDLRVDDQEQTHRMLKGGEVMGCISTEHQPMQGCRAEYLGCMYYRMLASPDFRQKWFSQGFSLETVQRAPAIIFDSHDELHHKLLLSVFGEVPPSLPAHYVPSVEKYPEVIEQGLAYGTLPDQQGNPYLREKKMVDLAPGHCVTVGLYYHCWGLKSALLNRFSEQLVSGARKLLDP